MRWPRNTHAQTPDKSQVLVAYASGHGDAQFLVGPPDPVVPMPTWWRTLHAMAPPTRVAAALREWTPTVELVLPSTLAALRTRTRDVEVVRVGPWFKLLYTVEATQDTRRYFVGGNPLQPVFPREDGVQPWWANVPAHLQGFYERMHDGFHDASTRTQGPAALRDVTRVATTAHSNTTPGAERVSYHFFSAPDGNQLVVDLAGPATGQASVWRDGVMQLDRVDFWPLVDHWMSTDLRGIS